MIVLDPAATARKVPCALGSHRVVAPEGALPQVAWQLDNTPIAHDNEILCRVETLNVDSASFRQIAEANAYDADAVGAHIMATVAERGKQHNPVTGSGGMFVGSVEAIGKSLRHRDDIALGDRIASLVSLTLTPLRLEGVDHVDLTTGQVRVRGHAVLFESAIYARLPHDIPEAVALAVLDVAGAPAQVRRLVQPMHTVCVIGADGKSGLLACATARERAGSGRVIGVVPDGATRGARLLLEEHFVDDLLVLDARDVLGMNAAIRDVAPRGADLTVNCVNVPGTELASILVTRDEGIVYFFSMSTSFTAAALGAEGVGRDVTMIVGNGYAKGHAAVALQTLRDHPALMRYFTDRYGSRS